MKVSHYFVAAALLLLLGASAMPVGLAAYAVAEGGSGPYAVAAGVWGAMVVIIAVTGPVVLAVAGIVSIWRRHGD